MGKNFQTDYQVIYEFELCKNIREAMAPIYIILYPVYIKIIEMAYILLGQNTAQILVYFFTEVYKAFDIVYEAICDNNDMFMEML